MNEPCFIYCHANGEAWPQTGRATQGSAVTLLFTCPLDWMPTTQKDFEAACRFYEIARPDLYRYSGDLIPF